ncbi:hypothetical protein H4K35_06360 [Myroides sp. NP-2]|uniref:DUF6266 family protein n=1 Tax=Myroides sp. NP-2 TaxID=2759945 RepID=UPI0015FBF9C7|nr:DUF6266 family protein [Myroides sp. NP-2]MBB1149757.1 hypothetical protein [Myroides sp. NP-2]
MAEIKRGILGGLSGKVGTVVGANWRGKNIIRVVPRKSGKKPSQLQLEQRSKFKLVSNFLQPFNALFSRYFGADRGLKSKVNLALSYHLQEAIEPQEDGFAIRFDKVVVSKGSIPTVPMNSVTVENDSLNFAWTSAMASGLAAATDLLTVVLYEKQQKIMRIFERVVSRDVNSGESDQYILV